MQHLNERNVFTKTITIIQIMNEMCTWTNLVHRTNIGISPLSSLLNMCFNIEYSCHTITNIKHGWQLTLQLMTN